MAIFCPTRVICKKTRENIRELRSLTQQAKVELCRVCPNYTPGITIQITLQRTSVSSAGHSYPYPELLEVLYASATIPGTSVSLNTSVPYPGFL